MHSEACLHEDWGHDTSHEPGTNADTLHEDLVGHCPPGQQPFWPEEVLDQAHYLLFLLASVHILYAAFSMGLALLHVRTHSLAVSVHRLLWICIAQAATPGGHTGQLTAGRPQSCLRCPMCSMLQLAWWRRWERQAVGKSGEPRGRHTVPRVGSTAFSHYTRALVMQFTLAMNSCVYLALRDKFLERLQLPAAFDFHRHVVASMEWQFAKAIRVDWLMWIIAVVRHAGLLAIVWTCWVQPAGVAGLGFALERCPTVKLVKL